MRVTIAAAVLMALFRAAPSDACTCVQQAAVCQEFWTAGAVFVGRVESIAREQGADGPVLRVALFVRDSFRNVRSERVVIRTPASTGACGVPFRADKEYLVYAFASGSSNDWTTTTCTRTRAIERASADLAYASRLADGGSASVGQISGRVILRTRDLARHRHRDQPMQGITLALTGTEATTRVVSDSAGTFVATSLPPGTYIASAEVDGDRLVTIFPQSIELADTRRCAELTVVVQANGRVRGRVVGAKGIPVGGLTVDLTISTGLDQTPGPERLRALTRLDGMFEIVDVPPGRFVVGINTRQGNGNGPRLFYPGRESLATAAKISVSAGDRIDLEDFVIPPTVSFVQLLGFVFETSGGPAEGARVYLSQPGEGSPLLNEPAITDSTGRFVLAAINDCRYRIFAERPRSSSHVGPTDSTDPFIVTATATAPPLRLTLQHRY